MESFHDGFMRAALDQAAKAAAAGEVPVGAVLVIDEQHETEPGAT